MFVQRTNSFTGVVEYISDDGNDIRVTHERMNRHTSHRFTFSSKVESKDNSPISTWTSNRETVGGYFFYLYFGGSYKDAKLSGEFERLHLVHGLALPIALQKE